jgi:hypothetical protein
LPLIPLFCEIAAYSGFVAAFFHSRPAFFGWLAVEASLEFPRENLPTPLSVGGCHFGTVSFCVSCILQQLCDVSYCDNARFFL